MKNKLMNNKGFTITELIVTFVIVMSITLGLFAVVDNYRERQQKATYRKELNSYKNEIVKIIQDDVLYKGVKKIEGIKVNDENGENGESFNQGIKITFKDDTSKELKVKNSVTKNGETVNGEIKYGNISYPFPNNFVKFTDDIIFSDSGEFENLNKRIYSINIELTHTELTGEVFDINIVCVSNTAASTSTEDDTQTTTDEQTT